MSDWSLANFQDRKAVKFLVERRAFYLQVKPVFDHAEILASTVSFCRYIELKECKPGMKKLREMLSEGTLGQKGHLDERQRGKSFEALKQSVQCSEEELDVGLKVLDAVRVAGKWFLLDDDYRMRILSMITNFMEENSWPMDGLVKSETVEALKEIEPEDIIRQVFEQYTKEDTHLSVDKLARFYGEFLLQTGSEFNLTDFMEMWKASLPAGIDVKLYHLNGLALVQKAENKIKYFPESTMTENVHERLELLFSAREKWTLEEIEPYVQRLTTPKLNVNALLTKFARASKVEGVKYFSSKHGK